jgi:hypothetical protein
MTLATPAIKIKTNKDVKIEKSVQKWFCRYLQKSVSIPPETPYFLDTHFFFPKSVLKKQVKKFGQIKII